MTPYFIGTILNISSIYMIAGLGSAIMKKTGEYNLGGEGQIYAGGFICAVLLIRLNFLPAFLAFLIAFLASFILCALIILLSAYLKKKHNADFLFTSFIISSALIPLIDGLITNKFKGTSSNLLSTGFIDDKFKFLRLLPPSQLNISFIFAIILLVLFYFIVYRTSYGRKLCIYGISHEFAVYAGYDENKILYSSAIISGGLHGLCGAFTICGTYYTCHLGFNAGLGWNSLSAALIGMGNPLLIIPASILLSAINTTANNIALYNNFGFDMSGIIQAIIMFIISIQIVENKRKK